eukprot:CAMPEP_0178414862 /NCGR_PEP_ID=MMETSP0689_2-20121128/23254_1 /TAXON_ID=160604 /ORGANISM="Amphidinium massartii, Strain CS-259" /LENGTH=488 /DNA_ID=CAMNT_0020036163 /DNA_START=56 /DNA_END=1522 /DNA_ORIENTATION=+
MMPSRCSALAAAIVSAHVLGSLAARQGMTWGSLMRHEPANGAEALVESAADYELAGPPLCDPYLVKEACKSMDLDGSKQVTLAELGEVMFVARPSLVTFLQAIGFQTAGQESGQDSFKCMDLCKAVVQTIPEAYRPPSSDIACRNGYEGEEAIVCDIDVSPVEMADLDFDTEAHDFHTGHPVNNTKEDELREEAQTGGPLDEPDDEEGEEMEMFQVLIRLANMFRIYPKLDVDVSVDIADVDISKPADSSLMEHGWEDANCSAACTTLEDCFERKEECASCSGCEHNYGDGRMEKWWNPFSRRRKTTTEAPKPQAKPAWLAEVEKVSVRAQAYVARALQLAPRSHKLMRKWFGRDDRRTLKEAMRVLNSLSGMLGNVAYEKGPKCGPHTYAYVYPYGPRSKNRKGEFVFFLCGVYFRSDLGEKIETLTHEGSHHALAYTDDVCGNPPKCEYKAYGRPVCQRLARTAPDLAIKNADSHCYFINDLNGHR